MKRKWPFVIIALETFVILLFIALTVLLFEARYEKTEILREQSPDGQYTVVIWRIGEPDWPFGAVHVEITLFGEEETPDIFHRFQADIANDGGEGTCAIDWLEDGVQITLSGSEQPDEVYILPFR